MKNGASKDMNLEEDNVSQEELSQDQGLLEEQMTSEEKGGPGEEDLMESSTSGLPEDSISQDCNISNNAVVSEDTSEIPEQTELATSDSEEKPIVKVEPGLIDDTENSGETDGEMTVEASVKSEVVQDQVEIKSEPVDVETEEDVNVKTEEMMKEEENVSDDESFTDAKDELEVEVSASALKMEDSPST